MGQSLAVKGKRTALGNKHGFSYLAFDSAREQIKQMKMKQKLKLDMFDPDAKHYGETSDLRKLDNYKMKDALDRLGIHPKNYSNLERWKKIDLLRREVYTSFHYIICI